MKRIIIILSLIIIISFVLLCAVLVILEKLSERVTSKREADRLPLSTEEKIDSFDVEIQINADSTITVEERIQYDFGSDLRHGIYRTIPITYKARGGSYSLRISGISVSDDQGGGYPFNIKKSFLGRAIEIKIGDPNASVTGKKTFVLRYSVKRAINYFSNHDELYWNVTGNEWQVATAHASARVFLPGPIEEKEARKGCFSGVLESNQPCASAEFIYNDDVPQVIAVDFSQDSLMPLEGLTVVVGMPKGIVNEPSLAESLLETAKDNGIMALPFAVLSVLAYLWYTRGRDPKGRGVIVAQYDAPDNLSAAQVGTMIDEKAHPKDVSAEIIQLAERGYIKIIQSEKKGLITTSNDYLLEKLKDEESLGEDFDKYLMQHLFSGNAASVAMSSLKNEFYKHSEEFQQKIYASLVSKGYFQKNPKTVRRTFQVIGIIFCIGSFTVLHYLGLISTVSIALSGVIIALFSFIMPARTKKGVLIKEDIKGLREYLTVAEKDRIRFHNAPEKKPEHFEELLPYAMALGVEKEWAKQFEGIYNQQPSWYSGSAGTHFNAILFADSLNRFSSFSNSALASRPHSAASGGSGFGGGGFSGGGFGGGGGGSW